MLNKKRYSELLGLKGDFQLDIVLLALMARYGYMTADQLATFSDMPQISTRKRYLNKLTDNKYIAVHSTFAKVLKDSGKSNNSKMNVYMITRPGVEYLSNYMEDTSWIKINRKLEGKTNHTLATLDYFYHLAGHPGVHTLSENFNCVINNGYNPSVIKHKAIADAILKVNNTRDYWLEADLGTQTRTQLFNKALHIADQMQGMDRLDVIFYLPVTRKYFSTVSRKALEARRKEEENRYNDYLALSNLLCHASPDRHLAELLSELEQLDNPELVIKKSTRLTNVALKDKITTKRQLNEAIPRQLRIREQARNSLVSTLATETYGKRRSTVYNAFFTPNPAASELEDKEVHFKHFLTGNALHVVSNVDEKHFTDLVMLKTGMYYDTLSRLFFCEMNGKDFFNLTPADEQFIVEHVNMQSTCEVTQSEITCHENTAFTVDGNRVSVIDCYFDIANIFRLRRMLAASHTPLQSKLLLVVHDTSEAEVLYNEGLGTDISIIRYETLLAVSNACKDTPYYQENHFDYLQFTHNDQE